ncbi:SRPBCC family protein [Chelatococcus reniformis]|uniref:SRPBCC family protein n=1 Tax=Chelatococcus reniformis TaxID=1494448 RepID=A0A916XE68_9HYPH|nr:SRPBCC family protein [Chelatococcus reniformis]GGC65117.1 hypothetical protein GCM10010994_24640 [Chelatococcus reniformis]
MTGRLDACEPPRECLAVRAVCILAAPATEVWALIGDFGGVAAWLPGIEAVTLTGQGIGAIRVCRTAAGTFRERLTAAETQSCRYVIDAGPLPVSRYEATLSVGPWAGGTHCRVVWTSTFTADGVDDGAARRRVERIFLAGLGGLCARYGAAPDGSVRLDNIQHQINGCLLVNGAASRSQPGGRSAWPNK